MVGNFFELLIEGDATYVRGMIAGYLAARDCHAEVFWGDQAGLASDGVLTKLRETLQPAHHLNHVLVDAATAELLRALKDAVHDPQIVWRGERPIEKAGFEYRFAVYQPEQGRALLEAFQRLPEGLELKGHKQNLALDPRVKGTELYTPAHEYELVGEGRVEGRVDKILKFHQELCIFAQVTVQPIRVQYGDR